MHYGRLYRKYTGINIKAGPFYDPIKTGARITRKTHPLLASEVLKGTDENN